MPARPTSWETFLRAHWGAIAGADFFTTEVWTWRGLVTFYTLFVIELATRRVQIVGCTPHPDEAFMSQAARTMTAADEGALAGCRVLICDRDQKWSAAVRHTDTRSAVQRFLVVRRRDAAAPARLFTPPDEFGREPEGFFAPPLDAFFPPDAADFLAVARDSFFAAVPDRVFVLVLRVFVLDADRFFAVDAPFRERAVAVGLRAGAGARRLDAASSAGSGGVSALEPLSCRALATDGALGNVDGSGGEVPAGTAWRISNRSRTTLCASFCLLRAWRISSPCRSRPATL